LTAGKKPFFSIFQPVFSFFSIVKIRKKWKKNQKNRRNSTKIAAILNDHFRHDF